MERIRYRITLDTHRTGIQRTLQGFETADKMSRCIVVSLTASGDTFEIPLDNVVAMMYVTTPNASEPSINECTIDGNTIIYDVLPIVEEGITEMQLKLIETSIDGAKSVLLAPRFAVEVTESGADDEGAEQTETFTALENAIARANSAYDSRLLRVEISGDCMFRAIYADGTVYENDTLKNALYEGNAFFQIAESWARGGTGMRDGEDTNNSMYFSNISKSSSVEASRYADDVREMTEEAKMYSVYTAFSMDFEKGELNYLSASYKFDIDENTGELLVEGELFNPESVVKDEVQKYLDTQTKEINEHIGSKDNPHGVSCGQIGAISKKGILYATLPASGWSAEAPYSQTVDVEGIKDGDVPIIGCGKPAEPTVESLKALGKAYAMLDMSDVTADGKITFQCYSKKPTTDIPVYIKI